MSEVIMYSSRYCPFCVRAKALLKRKKASVEELLVDGDANKRREMMTKSGRHTVPQIWIGDLHVGGCDELFLLEKQGKLDQLLNAA
jgi:glutaredoxin 3